MTAEGEVHQAFLIAAPQAPNPAFSRTMVINGKVGKALYSPILHPGRDFGAPIIPSMFQWEESSY
jgi:hypothetical protein